MSTIENLPAHWKSMKTYGVTSYGSGWRKDVINQCLEFVTSLLCVFSASLFLSEYVCSTDQTCNNLDALRIVRYKIFHCFMVGRLNIVCMRVCVRACVCLYWFLEERWRGKEFFFVCFLLKWIAHPKQMATVLNNYLKQWHQYYRFWTITRLAIAIIRHQMLTSVDRVPSTEEKQGSFLPREKGTKLF